jgi:hypothetical protein
MRGEGVKTLVHGMVVKKGRPFRECKGASESVDVGALTDY